MIKDGKESVLAFFGTGKKLHIIYNQYIYQLVKVYEIVNGIVAAMVLKLVDEFFAAYIQYHFVGMCTFYIITDSLCQMRLA